MSVLPEDSGSPRWHTIRHYGSAVYPFVLLPIFALLFVIPEIAGWVVSLAGISMIALSVWHASRPCLFCLAKMPTLPSAAAEKKMWWLRIHHRLRVVTVVLVLAVVTVAMSLAERMAGEIPPAVRSTVFMVVFVVPLALIARAGWHHSHLSPWCPFCDHGGGRGDRTPTPTPAPQPTISH